MVFDDKLLSLNQGISLTAFKDVIYRMIAIKKLTLNVSENYLKNYFYNWKNKNSVNTFYFAHDNLLTIDNNIFLQSCVEKIIFDPEKNKNIRLIYLIWSSPYHINRLKFSPHYYMDFTFIKPIGMLETLVVLYIDLYTGIKVPGCFITLNSKTQAAYEIIFNDFKNILTSNNTISIDVQTYTIDFEKSLENALKIIFPNCRRIGYFYHYVQCLVRWMKKNGFGTNEFKEQRKEIIYLLTIILFKYKSNKSYIEETIKNLIESYPNFITFFNYYKSEWYQYLISGVLDYTKVTKLQHSNSFIENYNKIIKQAIG